MAWAVVLAALAIVAGGVGPTTVGELVPVPARTEVPAGSICITVPRVERWQNPSQGNVGRTVQIVAHAGGSGMAPANTLAAFAAGLKAGADYLDMDAQLTADGVVVTYHNDSLSALCRGPYVGRDLSLLTFDQVRRMDCGNPELPTAVAAPGSFIPTLDEVMHLVRSSGDTHVKLAIEAKRPFTDPHSLAEYARRIIDVAVSNGMADRIVLSSKGWKLIKYVDDGKVTPHVALSPIVGHFTRAHLRGVDPADFGGYMGMAQAYGATAATIDLTLLTPSMVADAHARGLQVWAYTPNTPTAMVDAIRVGVDALITDYPLTAKTVVARELANARSRAWGVSHAAQRQTKVSHCPLTSAPRAAVRRSAGADCRGFTPSYQRGNADDRAVAGGPSVATAVRATRPLHRPQDPSVTWRTSRPRMPKIAT